MVPQTRLINVMALGGGTFGRRLDLVSGTLIKGVSVFLKGTQRPCPLHHVRTQPAMANYEPQVVPPQTLNLPVPWPWTSSLQDQRDISVVISHLVCGSLLQQARGLRQLAYLEWLWKVTVDGGARGCRSLPQYYLMLLLPTWGG